MKLDKGQYYGNILQSADIDGLVLTQSEYSAHSLLPTHYHQNPYFCFVTHGTYTEYSSGKNFACSKGDIVFHPGRYEHYNKFGNDASSCFNIEFTQNWLDKICFSDFNLNYIRRSSEPDTRRTFIRILKEFNHADSLSPLMIESLAIEALVFFAREDGKNNFTPYYVNKAIRFITEQFQTNLSLSELSAFLHISPGYLARSFRKAKGVTIGEFVRQYRVQKACEMLCNKKQDMLGIALELGFTDQSHFTKIFKKEIGVTPKQYRLLMCQNSTKMS